MGEACCDCWQVDRLGSSLDSAIFLGPGSMISVCLFLFLLKQGSPIVRECKYRKCGGKKN